MAKPLDFVGIVKTKMPFEVTIDLKGHFSLRHRQWRGQDLNLRPRGYEPRELPGCSTPRQCADKNSSVCVVDVGRGSISVAGKKGSQSFSNSQRFVF